jgi:threonine dehydrogenase-like Zn-dependent dehydrogenase
MRALTYHGAKDVRVDTVPDPVLRHDEDIVLRITATAICGSDLRLCRDKVPGHNKADILGHEFMGVVEDVGAGVSRLKRGDGVVVPYVIACGDCWYCSHTLFLACETTNPGRGASLNKKRVPMASRSPTR